MNLLFDQNISFRIVKKVSTVFPNSKQVSDVNLLNSSDFNIWEFAKKNNYCIVTFDNDFIDISVLKGFPPKIIWLRTGNTSTNFIAEKIIENKNLILDFIQNSENGYLEIK